MFIQPNGDSDAFCNRAPALDRLHRPMRDLRVSITDRCNLRCRYCMPAHVTYHFRSKQELLSYEEIARVAAASAPLGVRKVRITGGEPLVRRDVASLVGMLRKVPGITDLAMTTNGTLLRHQAKDLRDAGLMRLAVSLDTLRQDVWQEMAGTDIPLQHILDGISAAEDAGFENIHINVVVQRGVNDTEIIPLVDRFRGTGHIVRFIEYMDVGTLNRWQPDHVVPAMEMLQRIDARYPLRSLPTTVPGQTAQRFAFRDGAGEIGIIPSVTAPFCGGCVRLRMSADGKLYTCLFSSRGTDVLRMIRNGADDYQLSETLRNVWSDRLDRYSDERHVLDSRHPRVEMYEVGG